MRSPVLAATIAAIAAGCTPSATVRRTTPVANLQSYQSLLIRVGGAPQAQQYASLLEFAAADKVRGSCSFGQVAVPSQGAREHDLILDLTIQRASRGGDGLVQNPNLATVDITLVLSDGIDDALLGSADIRGKSSAVLVQGASPEAQAIDAVSERVAEILVKSGCSGARIARTEPSTADDDGGGMAEEASGDEGASDGAASSDGGASDDEALEHAEARNEEGKRLFRAADIAGARAQFEAAIDLVRDPRFVFNLCLAQEALGELDAATTTCQSVIELNPGRRLVEKARLRLSIIADKRG